MANLVRARVVWYGAGVVGGGLSTFYFTEGGTGFSTALGLLFDSMNPYLPSNVSVAIPNSGDLIDISTGQITGGWTDGSEVGVAGSGGLDFALGVGCRIRWNTAGIAGGRRVRGSTFVVPLAIDAYEGTGAITSTVTSAISTGVGNFLGHSGSEPVIWHRPKTGVGGSAHPITSGSVPDAVSWLRTRRT